MFTAGAMIDGAPPTYANATAARTGAEVRKAVDQRAIAGADWVKLYTKITPELLRPLMDEAAVLRLPVAAHLGKIDALTAARAGVASLERSEEHTSELQSLAYLVCRLLLEKKK